ncbi:MAG TPA: ECF transporter S component [Clostridiaceae bacterium]
MRTNKLVKISLLSTIAAVLGCFGLPIFEAWLKLDLGDLPAVIAAFAFGPVSGIVVELIKNLLIFVLKNSGTFGIGESANFLVGVMMVIPAGLIYQKHKSRKSAIIGLSVGVVSMVIGGAILNYLVLFPLYGSVLHFTLPKSLVFTAIVPFNLLKGAIIAVLSIVLYKRISPILHKNI